LRPRGLELSLWLLLAFIGLGSSTFLGVPIGAVAEAVEAAKSQSRGSDRAAQPAKLSRIVVSIVIRKDENGRAPKPAVTLADAAALDLPVAATITPQSKRDAVVRPCSPFNARAPPAIA
jgi:hypothetical protein